MYLLVRYAVGIIVEGVLLAEGKNRLRVALAGFPETMELRRKGTQWFTASGEAVEFDFVMSDRYQAESASCSSAVYGAMALALAIPTCER